MDSRSAGGVAMSAITEPRASPSGEEVTESVGTGSAEVRGAGTNDIGGTNDSRRPTSAKRMAWPVLVCVGVYAVLALAAYWPMWPGDSARIAQCPCADAGLNTWFLAWTPYAIVHGHNPFFTTWLNAPKGMNLSINAQMPLLGLLAAPLTLTAGPLSSLSFLMWIAFPLSASSMFLVLRRWTSGTLPAFAGGLLYGFSPYMAGQSTAHLHLIFLPFPPLIVLATMELFVLRGGSPRRWGVALGLFVAAQFFVSTEILAMTFFACAFGLLVLALARPGSVVEAVRFAARGIVWAAGIIAVTISYPLWMMIAGPLHGSPPSLAELRATPFRSDLLGPLLATSAERLAPSSWERAGDHLIALGDYSENGSYLGSPLLVLLVYLAVRSRHNRWLRLAVLVAVASFVISLGPSLHVDARNTGIPLPFALLQLAPLVDLMLPARISLITELSLAVALAIGLDELRRSVPWRSGVLMGARGAGAQAARPVRAFEVVAVLVLGACVVLSLLPRWPDPTVSSEVPRYFTSGATDRIPSGSVVLTYPYAMPSYAQAMVWQATAQMEFRLIGSYGLVPGRNGVSTLFPTQLEPSEVQQFFVDEAGGVLFYDAAPVTPDRELSLAIRSFARRYGVGSVLVDLSERHAREVDAVLETALGRPPVTSGGVAAWYGVQHLPDVRRAAP